MKRRDRVLFLATAANNKMNVALHSAAGVALVVSSIGFSSMIALYFGFDVFNMKHRPPFDVLAANKTLAISAAIVSALVSLVARVGQALIEAKVTISRERWFAEELRASLAAKQIPGNIARASNYYGRLSSASMRAVSIVGVLLVNLVGLLIALPPHYATVGIAIVLICSIGLYGLMRALAAKMGNATNGLFTYAKAINAWKLNRSHDHPEYIDRYYKSYYSRIVLASAFSFMPLFFALAFSLFILIMHELDIISVDFGEVFIAFTLLQAYLGLVSNFFGALVHGAAFLPAVKPYAGFIVGSASPQDNGTSTEYQSHINEGRALEGDALEEI